MIERIGQLGQEPGSNLFKYHQDANGQSWEVGGDNGRDVELKDRRVAFGIHIHVKSEKDIANTRRNAALEGALVYELGQDKKGELGLLILS